MPRRISYYRLKVVRPAKVEEKLRMAIYDKPVRLLIREMIADLAPEKDQVFTRNQAMGWFDQHYPKIKNSTVAAHLLRFSTNAPSRVYYNPRNDEDLLFQIDSSRFRLHDTATDPSPIQSPANVSTADADPLDEEQRTAAEFAYERDLQAFLAKNPSIIEPGLRLYEEEGITGIQFPVGGRFVDILCIDAEDQLVVIELKVSRGYDRVVGQLLRYMAWVERHQAEEGQDVRGVIIAREISEDLRLACSRLSNIDLFEYELSVDVRRIDNGTRPSRSGSR